MSSEQVEGLLFADVFVNFSALFSPISSHLNCFLEFNCLKYSLLQDRIFMKKLQVAENSVRHFFGKSSPSLWRHPKHFYCVKTIVEQSKNIEHFFLLSWYNNVTHCKMRGRLDFYQSGEHSKP